MALALVVGLIGVPVAVTIGSAGPAAAASTTCGSVLVNGNGWMGGNGVDVHSNIPDMETGKSCANNGNELYNLSANPPQWGYGWQCVELVERLYVSKGWSSTMYLTDGLAKNMYTDAANGKFGSGIVAHANGSGYTPVPGDVIVHSNGTYGHVAVVSLVSGHTITAVDQNRSYTGWETYAWDPTTGTASMSGVTISGFVHATANTYTNGSGSGGGTNSMPSGPWAFETSDGNSSSVAGQLGNYATNVGNPVTAIDYQGNRHVFYSDATDGTLRHMYYDNAWHVENLDGSTSDVMGGAIAAITATVNGVNTIQVFYYDTSKGTLRHAYYDTSWHFETLDSGGGDVLGGAIAARAFGSTIQVFYHDTTSGTLRHAYWDSNGWHFETLDGGSDGNMGGAIAATVDSNGTLQVFYQDATDGTLHHLYYDTSWHFETFDGSSSSVGGNVGNMGGAIAVTTATISDTGSGNTIQVFYQDATDGTLRHAYYDTSWHFDIIDGSSGSIMHQTTGTNNTNVGEAVSALAYYNTLQVFYYDATNHYLWHVYFDSSWHFEALDGASGSVAGQNGTYDSSVGNPVTAYEDTNGLMQVFYYGSADNTLRHAWWS